MGKETSTVVNLQLPCNPNGICMQCKVKPIEVESIVCMTCLTPWHVNCLNSCNKPKKVVDSIEWKCPDCTNINLGYRSADNNVNGVADVETPLLVFAIRAIELDGSLSEDDKARRRQRLLCGKMTETKKRKRSEDNVEETLRCPICMDWLDVPITISCGHNFCLKCFRRSRQQSKDKIYSCPKCRRRIKSKEANKVKINSTMVEAVHRARKTQGQGSGSSSNTYRPDKPFCSKRAQRNGMANASSGRTFVNIPTDHFGPILPEHDPEHGEGVRVGQTWTYRLECRQWGVHIPHIHGTGGQAKKGAQSVVLSGSYPDDDDHGDWFLFTGSGGKDNSGNKRTNKKLSFHQEFTLANQALRVSCVRGYPLRVIRSYKNKKSPYAPTVGLRYDGIYRIERCWKKVGDQGYVVCRFLFIRCDNERAPWRSDGHGDLPRPLPVVKELKRAVDIIRRMDTPSWDYDKKRRVWKWKKPPPNSKKNMDMGDGSNRGQRPRTSISKHLLERISCPICEQLLNLPVTTPCGHNFCKACLEDKFSGIAYTRDRQTAGGRVLRCQTNQMICPACPRNISDFLQELQVNRDLMDLVETFKSENGETWSLDDEST